MADWNRNGVCFVLFAFVISTFVGSRVVSFLSAVLRLFVLSLIRSRLYWFEFFCAGLSFQCICVVRCVSVLLACNHSTSPPGGNQVDGLPPALHDS